MSAPVTTLSRVPLDDSFALLSSTVLTAIAFTDASIDLVSYRSMFGFGGLFVDPHNVSLTSSPPFVAFQPAFSSIQPSYISKVTRRPSKAGRRKLSPNVPSVSIDDISFHSKVSVQNGSMLFNDELLMS